MVSKKILYESIINSVSKTIKKLLNESIIDDKEILYNYYTENINEIFSLSNPVANTSIDTSMSSDYSIEELTNIVNKIKNEILQELSVDEVIEGLTLLNNDKHLHDIHKISVQIKDSLQDNRLTVYVTSIEENPTDLLNIKLFRKFSARDYKQILNSGVLTSDKIDSYKTSVSTRVKDMVINNVTRKLHNIIDNDITVDITPTFIMSEEVLIDCAGYILESAIYNQIKQGVYKNYNVSNRNRRNGAGQTDFNIESYPIEVKSCRTEKFKVGTLTGNTYTEQQINELKNAPFGIVLIVGYSVHNNTINIDKIAVCTTDMDIFNKNNVFIPKNAIIMS